MVTRHVFSLMDPFLFALVLPLGAVGNSSGYVVVACTGVILFLVLRRSMLHAIGFTYAEIIPMHRWLGAAIVGWSTIHAIGYITYLGNEGKLQSDINFYDTGRGTLNMMGVFAYVSARLLCSLSLPLFASTALYILLTRPHLADHNRVLSACSVSVPSLKFADAATCSS